MAQDPPYRAVAPGVLQSPREEADWIATIAPLVDSGQYFKAFDLARAAGELHPDSARIVLLGALALIRSGAVEQARRFLAPIDHRFGTGFDREASPRAALHAAAPTIVENREHAPPRGSGHTEALAAALRDAAALRLLAGIYQETWRQLGITEDLVRGRAMAREAFRIERSPVDGSAAAAMCWLLDDRSDAERLAREALAEASASTDNSYETAEAIAIARLITGEHETAKTALRNALTSRRVDAARPVETARRLRTLAERGLAVPPALFDLLRPPPVVIFAGQPIDPPGSATVSFPPELEDAVAEEIGARLDRIGAAIGFCSAAAGSDILFIEALLERGGEVTVFLPFALDDFVATRVRPAGRHWERRFRNALELASAVEYATEDRYLGHDMLFRFNNRMIEGMARLRARFLNTDPALLLVWDHAAPARAGSSADFMDHWPDIKRLQIIDLDDLRRNTAKAAWEPSEGDDAPPPPPPAHRVGPFRDIRTLLFADMVGFTSLREEHMPPLWDFMRSVERRIAVEQTRTILIESWGDALYVAADAAKPLADYAFALLDAFAAVDARAHGLPGPLRLRVALHAGPVYEGEHPLTGRRIVYGGHVSRAARIEPVTLPDNVYTSRQFVALLTAEESAAGHEAQMTGGRYERAYSADYLGLLPLAKDYGAQPVYHLRRRRPRRQPEPGG